MREVWGSRKSHRSLLGVGGSPGKEGLAMLVLYPWNSLIPEIPPSLLFLHPSSLIPAIPHPCYSIFPAPPSSSIQGFPLPRDPGPICLLPADFQACSICRLFPLALPNGFSQSLFPPWHAPAWHSPIPASLSQNPPGISPIPSSPKSPGILPVLSFRPGILQKSTWNLPHPILPKIPLESAPSHPLGEESS